MQAKMNTRHVIDVAALGTALSLIEESNAAVRHKHAYDKAETEYVYAVNAANRADEIVENARRAKAATMEAMDLPLDGLGIDDGDVTYNGVPWAQCGEAERYMIAAAVGLRAIPADGARVLIMRNGGALDDENLAALQDMVRDEQAMMLIEVPRTTGDGLTAVIEDGKIPTPAAAVASAPAAAGEQDDLPF